jgi:hypothetical protein
MHVVAVAVIARGAVCAANALEPVPLQAALPDVAQASSSLVL